MSSEREKQAANLLKLKPGDSFFVACLPDKLTHIRRLGYKLGIKLSFRFVAVDPIYGQTGTRVIRKR